MGISTAMIAMRDGWDQMYLWLRIMERIWSSGVWVGKMEVLRRDKRCLSIPGYRKF